MREASLGCLEHKGCGLDKDFAYPSFMSGFGLPPLPELGTLWVSYGFNVGLAAGLEFLITRLWQFPGQPSESEDLEQ